MEIIPVIDVRNGVVVRAIAGDRVNYRQLETPLAASADPVAVARGFLSLFPFQRLYLADLDGIEGRGRNRKLVECLAAALPGVELWIDDGSVGSDNAGVGIPPTLALPTSGWRLAFGKTGRMLGWGSQGGRIAEPMIKSHVLGSESLASLADYDRARLRVGAGALLSLDFRGKDFVGPQELLEDSATWPERVIVMTFARVGTGGGPDLMRIGEIARRAGERRRVYAAGGVRGLDDLRAVRRAGAVGALVATALHQGKIKAGDLREIADF